MSVIFVMFLSFVYDRQIRNGDVFFFTFAKIKSMRRVLPLLAVFFAAACNNPATNDDNNNVVETPSTGIAAPANIQYNIISVYPHDPSSYTQGLEIFNGKFYEGSGDFENSAVRIVDIKSGKVEKKHPMGSEDVFGEGITILNGLLYQLTWKNNVVNVYNVNNIDKPVKTFPWNNEGWGITHNGNDLIISDGSANLYIVNPTDFRVKTTIQVNDNLGPVDNLNELEFIDGYVYANVYLTDYIVKIDPANGHVVGKINLQGLISQYAPDYIPKPNDEVLNGIAWDSTTKHIYITGKRWPKMFEMKLN